MAIPEIQSLLRPMLQALQGGPRTTTELVEMTAVALAIGEAERTETLAHGRTTVFANRVHWALVQLGRYGLIERVRQGLYKATEAGLKIVGAMPENVTLAWLAENVARPPVDPPDGNGPGPGISKPPDEQIQDAIKVIDDALREELLRRILESPPSFFEKLVVKLLAVIYGIDEGQAAKVLGGGGDGGLDGVVHLDVLGLDEIYLQAKRYRDGAVSVETVRAFAGALAQKGAQKGVLITTSYFTSDAKQFADTHQLRRIKLVDGGQLTTLMIEHGIGVLVDSTYVVKKIDTSFFAPDDIL